MANRNPKTGGTQFVNGEVLYDYDLDDTIAATTYHRIAYDATQTTSNNVTQTITISVPAGSVYKYIEIKARILGSADQEDSSNGLCYFRLYKTYSAVDTDLIADHVFAGRNIGGVSAGAGVWSDRSEVFINYYYEPTADEKTNGFDVKISILDSADSTTTYYYCNIMGI
jgi:hypothetical protein